MKMSKVVILTIVHSQFNGCIFLKEVKSLVSFGYE